MSAPRIRTEEELAAELAAEDREEFVSIAARIAVANEQNPAANMSPEQVAQRSTDIAARIIAAGRERYLQLMERVTGERPEVEHR